MKNLMINNTSGKGTFPSQAPLPPPSLRLRVSGSDDLTSFLEIGQRCSQDIQDIFANVSKELQGCEAVLDFGCGCGRVIRWFNQFSNTTRLFGVDIDREAIDWCMQNLPFASFKANSGLPPLSFPDEYFDAIYAISVFSHLNERYQFYWLHELRRLVKRGGIVLLSIHGEQETRQIFQNMADEVVDKGMVFLASKEKQFSFPDWYQTSFHSKKYIFHKYTEYFDIVDYISRGINNHQDVVLLRKKENDDLLIPESFYHVIEDHISQIESDIAFLENSFSLKNDHIKNLEGLIRRLESGRTMRLLKVIEKLKKSLMKS
jgi:SAM-dependent methyltransferase